MNTHTLPSAIRNKRSKSKSTCRQAASREAYEAWQLVEIEPTTVVSFGHGTIALIELVCFESFGGRVISSNSGPQVLRIRI